MSSWKRYCLGVKKIMWVKYGKRKPSIHLMPLFISNFTRYFYYMLRGKSGRYTAGYPVSGLHRISSIRLLDWPEYLTKSVSGASLNKSRIRPKQHWLSTFLIPALPNATLQNLLKADFYWCSYKCCGAGAARRRIILLTGAASAWCGSATQAGGYSSRKSGFLLFCFKKIVYFFGRGGGWGIADPIIILLKLSNFHLVLKSIFSESFMISENVRWFIHLFFLLILSVAYPSQYKFLVPTLHYWYLIVLLVQFYPILKTENFPRHCELLEIIFTVS
jgi:hypothetical protein